jgi:N-succinyl-L-ornithine transcarbamylase
MKNFLSVNDVSDLRELLLKAKKIKENPLGNPQAGKGKYLGLIFLNPSLRTRLSTQRAAYNLGLQVMVINLMEEGWKIETSDGVIMDGDHVEHIKEAAAVIGRYCEIIGIRTFPGLKNRDEDYSESILTKFINYSKRPVISLESATRHPLQSFADIMTIEEYKLDKVKKPRVVLTWAPHPKVLPQSVPNSFVEWTLKMEYDLVITHPLGYELEESLTENAIIEYNQDKALEGADFVYVKNWSSYSDYGKILSKDRGWTITLDKIRNTNNARVMHCLPVRRNIVIAEDVLESEHSIVIPEAENRIYTAQAVLSQVLTDNF